MLLRHEKLQVLYWLKTQNGRQRIVCCCAATGNIVPQYKDGCLVIEKGE
jgi:hypothetical protein